MRRTVKGGTKRRWNEPLLDWAQGNPGCFCSNQQWNPPFYEHALWVAPRPSASSHYPCGLKNQPQKKKKRQSMAEILQSEKKTKMEKAVYELVTYISLLVILEIGYGKWNGCSDDPTESATTSYEDLSATMVEGKNHK